MKTFSNLKELNEAKYGQPLYGEKDHMKNLLIAACGNDRRVLDDIVDVNSFDVTQHLYDFICESNPKNILSQKKNISQNRNFARSSNLH